jgi:hypothetical protein
LREQARNGAAARDTTLRFLGGSGDKVCSSMNSGRRPGGCPSTGALGLADVGIGKGIKGWEEGCSYVGHIQRCFGVAEQRRGWCCASLLKWTYVGSTGVHCYREQPAAAQTHENLHTIARRVGHMNGVDPHTDTTHS